MNKPVKKSHFMKRLINSENTIRSAYFLMLILATASLSTQTWASTFTGINTSETDRAASIIALNTVTSHNAGNDMLQFKVDGHILGFRPNKVYLAGLDHALTVEFLGTSGVKPTSVGNSVHKEGTNKTSSLTKIVYRNLWKGISLQYEATDSGIAESTYHVAPGADTEKIRLRCNVPVNIRKDGSLKFTFDGGYLTESPPVAWQEIAGKKVSVNVAFKVTGQEIGFEVGQYDPRHPLIIDPTYAWHTFYGLTTSDYAKSIALDSSGNIYVTGYSGTSWGSPLHAHSGGYSDIFVLKLNSNGVYQWHTFYGSSGDDIGYDISVDNSGNVYVTGENPVSWGSPLHAHSGGDSDIFVLKLNSYGEYQWHTYYGSSSSDHSNGIVIDGSDNIYVSGYGKGSWWSPLHAHSGGNDVFILKLNNNGGYQWHTYYGSNGDDYSFAGIALDGSGNAYLTGYSDANWGAPLNAHSGDNDVFVLKLDTGGTLQWNTFYGSSSGNYGTDIAVDIFGSIYVTGSSHDNWGSPLQAHNGTYSDAFVLKLDGDGAFQWNTFYGSSNQDFGYGITTDLSGNIYVTGKSDFTWGTPLHAFSGDFDVFVLKLNSNGNYHWHTFYGSGAGDAGSGIALDGGSNIYLTGEGDATWGVPLHAYSGDKDIMVMKLGSDAVSSCTYSLSNNSENFDSASYTSSVTVSPSESSCSWSVQSNDSWITITSDNWETGLGTVTYTLSANTSESSRTGTMTIAGQTFTVTQNGATADCTYAISSSAASFSTDSASGTFSVNPSSGGCSWTAVSSDSWLTITSGSWGIDVGIVSYSITANRDGSSRTGTITVGGQTFTVIQSGTTPSYETVQKAYIGYYQRPADPAGLIWWANKLGMSGGNLTDIIEAFANSDESRALYGTIDSGNIASVINAIYQALFNRDPDAAGRDWYVAGFNAGDFSAATIMLNILYGAQNDDLVTLNNKLTTSNLFTKTIDPELDGANLRATYTGDADAVAARYFLNLVTSSYSTIPTQNQTTEYIQSYIADAGDAILTP